MKLQNGEIWAGYQALVELSEKDLPVKVSFGLAKINIALKGTYEAVEKIRQGLVQKHGTPKEGEDAAGNPFSDIEIKQGTKAYDDFSKEFTELITEEVEIEFEMVKLPAEVDGKPFQVAAKILAPLEKFVGLE